jgi:cytochrome c oxidase subunit II
MTDTATKPDSPAPAPEETPVRGRVTIIFLVLTVLLVVFGIWWVVVSLPTPASDTMKAVKDTMIVFSIAAAPVMALVWGIAYFSLRHWGKGAGEEPPADGPPLRSNTKVILGWVIISSLLTLILLVWGLAELTATTATASSPLVVQVTGQQWVWTFKYPDEGNVASSDLVLPVDRPVLFEVTSTDVIHSFWLPSMGVKVDANPGVTTQTSTTPTRLGTYTVRCAELCGLNHAFMQTSVNVVSTGDFNNWVADQSGSSQ